MMRWLESLNARIWWRRRWEALLAQQLTPTDHERVDKALAESLSARIGLAGLLRELDPKLQTRTLAEFARELANGESPERALLHLFRWVVAEQ